eukprot:1185144-Prorocentrum_minimum.AAC.1
MQKSKSVAMSNWEAHELSRNQIFYAAQDAYAGVWLLHELFRKYVGSGANDWELHGQRWGALYANIANFKALTQLPDLSIYPEEVRGAVQAAKDRQAESQKRKNAKLRAKQIARESTLRESTLAANRENQAGVQAPDLDALVLELAHS